MFHEGRVFGGKRGTHSASFFARRGKKGTQIILVEIQVVAIDDRLFAIQWKALTRLQLQFARRIRSQNIPLMQPERLVLNAQVAGSFVERGYCVGRVENYLEHGKV